MTTQVQTPAQKYEILTTESLEQIATQVVEKIWQSTEETIADHTGNHIALNNTITSGGLANRQIQALYMEAIIRAAQERLMVLVEYGTNVPQARVMIRNLESHVNSLSK